MDQEEILAWIAGGRTDRILDLVALPDWRDILRQGEVKPLQWLVYHGDVTALKMVRAAGDDLSSIDLDRELGHAAFCGHWKMCDFLISLGASPRFALPDTGETALHSALCKAGRPPFTRIVQLLLERGADPNAATIAGQETGAFMRDVRTCGETPLHRAAAYGDEQAVSLLLAHGADRAARDVNGDSPLTWASRHLRPGSILFLLAHGDHQVSEQSRLRLTSDHGAGWGYGMERNLLGEYLAESQRAGGPTE
jgi:hypothetical protein